MFDIGILEPSDLLRKFLENFLRGYGFGVRSIQSSVDAQLVARDKKVRLILVDCDTNEDIPNLCSTVRKTRPTLPIVLLSRKSELGDPSGLHLPKLRKPVSVIELIRLVQSLSSGDETQMQEQEKPEMTSEDNLVLVVDDDSNYRNILRTFLEDRNLDTVEAGDGVEALEVLRKHPSIDTFIVDLDMPRMNGKELITKIRQRVRHPSIMVMTGSTDEVLKEYVVSVGGAFALIEKPFSLEAFATFFDLKD